MGFTSAGLSQGVTFSFLISSPMVDLGSLVLLMGVFGYKIALAYVVMGLVIAVAGGTLIEHLHMEDQVADFIRQARIETSLARNILTVRGAGPLFCPGAGGKHLSESLSLYSPGGGHRGSDP